MLVIHIDLWLDPALLDRQSNLHQNVSESFDTTGVLFPKAISQLLLGLLALNQAIKLVLIMFPIWGGF